MIEAPVIPGYRIQSRLGQGGMATVYLAIQQSFEREVALKVMSPLLNSDPSFAERFKREARIVAQLNHASIVPVFDVGEHLSFHYLSMEYLPAGELKRRILDRERDLNLAVNVCTALSSALEVAHRKGFVHRDIKPENILFREDGTPVLTDFGIARALDSSMTLAGTLVGTPDYMSPEQVKGLELDGRSDLYSVGIVFYEILTGSVPFKADSKLSVALKQVGEPLPPLPPEHADYQEFLDCLTAKNREERFASGAEVVRALRLISAARSGRDRAPSRALVVASGQSGGLRAGTQPRMTPSPTPAFAKSYVSDLTLARPRVAGADALKSMLATAFARLPNFHDRRLQIAAAVVIAIALCLGLLFVTRLHKGSPTSAAIQRPLNTMRAALAGASQGLAMQATSVGHLTSTSVQHDVAADAITATAAAAREEEAARHKRQLEERRQRKAEAARLAAEARAAQLAVQAAQIQNLLAEAKTRYAAGALWQPIGSSAADSYRAILTLEPQHAEALAGAQRVANVLVEEAEDAEASGNLDSSRQLIDQVQSLQPTHPKLPELQARFQQLQSTPVAMEARDRGRLEKATKYIGRAVESLGRTPLNFKAVDDATDQYDRALSTAPKAPGLPLLKERLIAAYPIAVQAELDVHDAKGAQKLIGNARKRKLSSPELDQLETTLQSGSAAEAAIKEAGVH